MSDVHKLCKIVLLLQKFMDMGFGTMKSGQTWRMISLILKFALDDVVWTKFYKAHFLIQHKSCSEGKTILYPSFQKPIFVPSHTK